MKKLSAENLKSRRAFLRASAKRSTLPLITVYLVNKTAPKVLAREPE
jgi:hypothetical protein